MGASKPDPPLEELPMTRLYRMTLAAVALSATFASTSASALSLNTSGLKANSVLTLSAEGVQAATGAGVSFVALGNMTKTGELGAYDPETDTTTQVPVYNQPVTKADVSIGWDLKVKPTSGKAIRSALQLVRNGKAGTKNWVVLANFDVDFKGHVLYGDVFTSQGTVLNHVPVYNFKDNGDLKIGLKGLSLVLTQSVSQLVFDPVTVEQIATTLNLSKALRAALETIDWGGIAIGVNSNLRIPAVSNKPLTIADIPAP
jgi:hypothetical protein